MINLRCYIIQYGTQKCTFFTVLYIRNCVGVCFYQILLLSMIFGKGFVNDYRS